MFDRPDGGKIAAYRAEPRSASKGAIIVIHEWYGLTSDIEDIADRFASEGYVSLCPDLYHGKLATSTAQAQTLMNRLDGIDAVKQDVRGVATALVKEGHKICVLGFCLGGALSLSSAVHVPELSAAVCFYGIPPAERADPAQIKIPVLAHFATQDGWCTPERVRELEAKMRAANAELELHRYEAQHAFFNPTRPVHDAVNAKLAWDRTLEFLAKKIAS
jgi:carboxymethylenebutenolidase